MPTSRPRHQITETADVTRALEIAERRWPNEPRSKLLLRLVEAGSAALEEARSEEARQRRAAIDATSGKYAGVFAADFLSELREDWPE